jgi:putative ABC transport system permease protein
VLTDPSAYATSRNREPPFRERTPADAAAPASRCSAEEPADFRVGTVLDLAGGMLSDLRLAIRTLRRSPGFAVVAVAVLGLAIGANATFFSALHALLERSLPLPHPERLVSVWSISSNPQLAHFPFINSSPPDYSDWAAESTSFRGLAAIEHQQRDLGGAGEPLAVTGLGVTANFFDVLGSPPALGRGFRSEETAAAESDVVVLSHSLWQRAFGGDPGILGRSLTLDGRAHRVVGVAHADAEFRQDFRAEFYLPLHVDPAGNRFERKLWVLGRLKPGVTQAQALAELQGISSRLAERYPDSNRGWSVKLIPLPELLFGDLRRPVLLLYVAAALVVLIACANLAGLLLARGLGRAPEMAVRSALGAGRLRLCRQMLTESLLLSVLGGAVGLVLSSWGVGLMRALLSTLQRSGGVGGIVGRTHIGLSPWVVLFTVALSFGATLLFGLLPAWEASGARSAAALRGERAAGEDRGGRRLSRLLAAGEIALSFLLLTGFSLLVESLEHLSGAPLGYGTSELLAVQLTLPRTPEYAESASRARFVHRVLERMRAVPGVLAAGAVNIHPLSSANVALGFTIVGRERPRPGEETNAEMRTVSTDYFRAMRIPLRRGRLFSRADDGSRAVAIVDEELARRYFTGEDPVGREISVAGHGMEIVGVVGSVQPPSLAEKRPRTHLYTPVDQFCFPDVTFTVRTLGDPTALGPAMRQAVWDVNPRQPIAQVQSLRSLAEDRLAMPRLVAWLAGSFATSALALALLGLYGVLAYSVRRQTRELGVRIALGAERRDILRLVLRRGMAVAGIGSLLGLAAATVLFRVMASLLHGVSPWDPLAYGLALTLVVATSLLASWLPARRAAAVDPARALRSE